MLISNPEILLIILFGGLIIGLATGFPVAFAMFGASVITGFLGVGPGFFYMMVIRVFETMHNYILASIILFVYMGIMLEHSGAAERLFSSTFNPGKPERRAGPGCCGCLHDYGSSHRDYGSACHYYGALCPPPHA